jgi:hypothetical protein
MKPEILDGLQEAGDIHPIIRDELVASNPVGAPEGDVETPDRYPVIVNGAIDDCTPVEFAMVQAAYVDLRKVISSAEFKEAVLNASFTETNNLSNQAIYDLMVAKSPIAVDFEMFTGGARQNHLWHTMGYEDSKRPTYCFANRYFVQDESVCASLILHETMHILGFTHYGNKTSSVPYTMNRIYEGVTKALAG